MKLVFFGSPEFALPSLKKLVISKHHVLAVVSQPEKPRGRKQVITPTSVSSFAAEKGIRVLTPKNLNDDHFVSSYKALGPQINVVVAYGRILPNWIIEYPQNKTINAHASLLPKYRGAAPIQRSLLGGDKETGITIQQVVDELDAGDILLQKKIEIAEEDNSLTLSSKLADLSADLLLQALDLIQNDQVNPVKQDVTAVSYAAKVLKEDQILDFSEDALVLCNKIRALSPRPGAYFIFNGKRLKVHKAKICAQTGEDGQVIEVNKSGILVGAGKRSLLLEQVQGEGGKIMNAYDFARGHQIKKGVVFKWR